MGVVASGAWISMPPAATASEGDVRVSLAGTSFTLEVADDPASLSLGLSYRSAIPRRGGMIFVFPDDRLLSFWMRHCLVDIGVLFLDRSGVIVASHEMKVEPPKRPGESELDYSSRLPRYGSGVPARFAIELRAGTIEQLGLEVGQRVDLSGSFPPPR
jgi:uncharacterized membrane protein (UPF0127 family)